MGPSGTELMIIGVILGFLGFWVWSLIDILRSEFKGSNKVVWLLVVFFLNWMGSMLYVLIGRSQRINTASKQKDTV